MSPPEAPTTDHHSNSPITLVLSRAPEGMQGGTDMSNCIEQLNDPVNGDSGAVIDGRIRQMLALWTNNGVLTFQVGGPRDGNDVGRGDPEDPLTCPAPSADPDNRGTLCTFFKYVAGSFQPQTS
jgi:hypothetical protein